MGYYPRLDKSMTMVAYSYETLLCEGSVDGSGKIGDTMIEARGMVGYDSEFHEDVRFPGDPLDPKEMKWDVCFENGDVRVAEDVEAVATGVVLSILTMRGELEYPPFEGFGSNIYKSIYQNVAAATLRELENAVWLALNEMDRIRQVLGVHAYRADSDVVAVEASVETVDGEVDYLTIRLGGG